MEYKYELHFHSSECSKCSNTPARQMVQALAERGYAGGVLTNHFLGGNTAVPKELSWPEKIHIYYGAYESALQEARRLDFDVFFGLEHAIPNTGKEFLTYGIGLDFLLQNPDLVDISIEEYIKRVHAAGGVVIQAHPFRQAPYIQDVSLCDPALLDGAEVFNYLNRRLGQEEQNQKAFALARQYDLIPTAGGDVHRPSDISVCGMVFDHRLKTERHLLRALRNREGILVLPE